MFNKAKKVLSKLLTFSFVACCTIGLTMGIAGCDDDNNNANTGNNSVVSVLDVKKEDGKLTITYTDGKTETITISSAAACDHEKLERVQIKGNPEIEDEVKETVAHEHRLCAFLDICKDCGSVTVIYDEAAHAITTVAATCTEASKETCEWCGYEVADADVDPALDHDWTTKYSVNPMQTICMNGGYAVTYCARCDEVKEVEIVDPIGHHSTKWEVKVKPEMGKPGELIGICNGCDLIVNDQPYAGCGKEVPYTLPALDAVKEDKVTPVYTESEKTQADCGVEGTAKYSIVVDGQTFTFEASLPTKSHMIKSNNEAGKIALGPGSEIGSSIDKNDERFIGWSLLANEEHNCKNEAGANAVFTCEDCGKYVAIKVITKHTRPSAEKVTFTPWVAANPDAEPAVEGNPDTYSYECTVCKLNVSEKVDHDLDYRMEETDVEGVFDIYASCKHASFDGETKCSYDTLVKDDVKAKIVDDPALTYAATCDKEGKTTWTYTDGNETITVEIIEKKIPHLFKGEQFTAGQKVDAAAHPDIVPVDGDKGSIPSCDAEKAVLGVFTCETCEKLVGVSLYTAHVLDPAHNVAVEGFDYINKLPTCEEANDYGYYCKNCQAWIELETREHDLKLTYVTEDAEKFVIKEECQYEDCDYVDEDAAYAKADWKEATKLSSTCEKEGKLILEKKDETKKLIEIVIVKTPHTLTLGGVKTLIEKGKVYDYVASKMNLVATDGTSALPACNDPNGIDAIFECEVCANKFCGVKVKLPHTRPTDAKKITTVAPTCTTEGYDEWYCTVCQKTETGDKLGKDNKKAALGHTWTYTVTNPTDEDEGTLKLTCTYDAKPDEEGGECGTVLEVTLPVLGEELTDGTAFYAKRDIKASCEEEKLREYTISAELVAELINKKYTSLKYTEDDVLDVVFTEVLEAAKPHTYGNNPLLTWTVIKEISGYKVTYTHTGKLCNECGMLIIFTSNAVMDWVEIPEAPTPVVPVLPAE